MPLPKPKLFQRWTPEEKAIAQRLFPTGGVDAVMKATGRSRGAVLWMRQVLHLRRARFWTPERDNLLRAKYGHVPRQDLAREIGNTPSAVTQRANKLGLDAGRCYTPEEIATLKRLYLTHTAAAIAELLGVNEANIFALARKHGLRKRKRSLEEAKSEEGLRTLESCLRTATVSLDDRKGADMSEWPADLRIRQFPEVTHAR